MKILEVDNQNIKNLSSQSTEAQKIEKTAEVEEQKVEEKSQKSEKKENVNQEEIENGLEKLNETVQTFHQDLQFEIHEESERMMTKLVDLKKHETIKEFPPKEMLDMLGRIKKAVGLIIDEKI